MPGPPTGFTARVGAHGIGHHTPYIRLPGGLPAGRDTMQAARGFGKLATRTTAAGVAGAAAQAVAAPAAGAYALPMEPLLAGRERAVLGPHDIVDDWVNLDPKGDTLIFPTTAIDAGAAVLQRCVPPGKPCRRPATPTNQRLHHPPAPPPLRHTRSAAVPQGPLVTELTACDAESVTTDGCEADAIIEADDLGLAAAGGGLGVGMGGAGPAILIAQKMVGRAHGWGGGPHCAPFFHPP